jgi:hypothetical protein
VTDHKEEQLAWEARQRPKAGAAALAAALLTVASSVWAALAFQDQPQTGVLAALERAAQPGPVGSSPSLRIPYFEYLESHATDIIATGVLRGLALAGIGVVLAVLAAATRARRPELPRFAPTLALFGSVLVAIATILTAFAQTAAVSKVLDGPRTVDAAEDLAKDSFLVTAQLIGLPGTLALALAFVLICLNAMRAGLLTRFMGILGIITGALLIFPIGSPIPVVQIFWLLAVGLMLLGRTSNVPPAWAAGEAIPWPSNLERRMGPSGRAAPATEPVTEPAVRSQEGMQSRKKRKKRR